MEQPQPNQPTSRLAEGFRRLSLVAGIMASIAALLWILASPPLPTKQELPLVLLVIVVPCFILA